MDTDLDVIRQLTSGLGPRDKEKVIKLKDWMIENQLEMGLIEGTTITRVTDDTTIKINVKGITRAIDIIESGLWLQQNISQSICAKFRIKEGLLFVSFPISSDDEEGASPVTPVPSLRKTEKPNVGVSSLGDFSSNKKKRSASSVYSQY